ncbi:ATP synthase subunit delta [Bartonella bacilliformis str. Heidi Mejia]|uniref:ATP synthase subunit delta n=2 Tax=Bartonella bacilliformis TaxID=774 RepID=ATPD_BARBK|nr:F0F1 ATP synthase subunit delta [Bartonella bacilliformis]A1UR46.1 RecName: Full=ATP synthase subunit delta; AltName: Full=ATP synthase F(1) sector subunit delta; AltName: Full=F-type ATPase subunit delta; Short=F-ATPase subunit delta [Bartonella bacilliformis KC583]ABM44925.1 ATP synthase F1, delta subunit [Bartonella bacilliformis KC583]AMG85340.1 ATP synthase subunit delta [Bartonella bacilliformis]EKS46005.1 F0F1 ATP synthase subunit delta [Bartonella bacilliformis INS]EYS88757.1 ATP sy
MSDSFSLLPLPLVSQRYAHALFDLVQKEGYVGDVEKALASFQVILEQDKALKHLVQSPFLSVKEQVKAVCAVCENLGLAHKKAGQILRNFLCVVAANRRLSALSGILQAFQRRVALSRGEVSAQVISAHPLDADQKKELCVALESVVGGKVTLRLSVDPAILGGLIVRLGLYQIDTSLATQLSSLKLALKKEVS